MSILRSKHSGWTHEGRRTPHFGGGGGGGPASNTTTGTTYNTNIPEYAQPYVETMLGATQKQLFDMQGNEITGFKPYQPYSKDFNKYVASFQPLQEEAITETTQLETPGQFGDATTLAGASGVGSIDLAGQAAGAGANYARMATDPTSMQGYMSPYMQNVVDYQKSQALRDYGIGTGMRKAQAVGQGAFGGSRQAIVESEAERALGNQLQGITALGSQKAFEDAQRQQQFGAQLGMQGLQTGLQGLGQAGQAASTLGDLGSRQLAAQQNIIQTKYGMGQQQQAMEQQKINQAIQDWANTQQYPLMQLGVMSNMLRGLPMQASTTNQYTAAPNALTQGIGAAGAGASLYNALRGGKEGGLPKEFKPSKTGIKSYYEGDVVESTKSDLYDLSLDELDKRAKSSPSPTIKRLATAIAKEKRMGLAGGGIIAFSEGETVKADPEMVRQAYIDAAKIQAADLPPAPVVAPDAGIGRGRGSGMGPGTSRFKTSEQGEQDIRVGRGGIKPEVSPRVAAARANEANQSRIISADQLNAEARQSEADYEAARPKPPVAPAAAPAGIKAAPAVAPADAPAGIKTAPAVAPVPGSKPSINELAPSTVSILNALPPELKESYAQAQKRSQMTAEDFLNEQTALEKKLGVDDKVNERRKAEVMAERASSKDEYKRQQNLRLAQFFASWGTTPGNTLVAGMDALKKAVPDFIADDKEQRKYLKDINKTIYDLDNAVNLEKKGKVAEAIKAKEKAAGDMQKWYEPMLKYQSERMSDQSKERVATINAASRDGGSGGGKDRRFYEEEIGKLDKQYNDLTAGKDTPYVRDQKLIDRNKEKAEKGELSPAVKNQYDAAVKRNATIENEYKTRRSELVTERDRSKGTSAAPAPAPTKTELPPGAIPGSKQIGTSKGVPVYEAPDGKRYTLKD